MTTSTTTPAATIAAELAGKSATEIHDWMFDLVWDLVTEVNAGRKLTRNQFADAIARTHMTLLTETLAKLDAEHPETARRFRLAFLAENSELGRQN